MKIRNLLIFFMQLIMLVALTNCSKEEPSEKSGMASISSDEYNTLALEFTRALAMWDYPKAYAMTSKEHQSRITLDEMKRSFEAIISDDWGTIGAIDVQDTMTEWPDKRPSDLVWIYVSIGGDGYSEAVTTLITLEGNTPKIREIEYGRP
jgi:hypothetical protein